MVSGNVAADTQTASVHASSGFLSVIFRPKVSPRSVFEAARASTERDLQALSVSRHTNHLQALVAYHLSPEPRSLLDEHILPITLQRHFNSFAEKGVKKAEDVIKTLLEHKSTHEVYIARAMAHVVLKLPAGSRAATPFIRSLVSFTDGDIDNEKLSYLDGTVNGFQTLKDRINYLLDNDLGCSPTKTSSDLGRILSSKDLIEMSGYSREDAADNLVRLIKKDIDRRRKLLPPETSNERSGVGNGWGALTLHRGG